MLFWVIKQHMVVIPDWHFRTTYLSNLQGSRNPRRKDLRSALFCGMIQYMVVILYKHFGKNYRFHLRGKEIQEEWISWFLKMVQWGITTICCVISQNSADLSWLSYSLPLWKLECVTTFTHSTICSYAEQVNAIHTFSPCSVVSLFLHLCLDRIQDDACLCLRRLLAWKALICLAPKWVLRCITVPQKTFPAACCCALLPTVLSWSYTV